MKRFVVYLMIVALLTVGYVGNNVEAKKPTFVTDKTDTSPREKKPGRNKVTVEEPTTEAPTVAVPEEPTTEAPTVAEPEEPTTEAPTVAVPEEPTTEAPTVIVPEEPTTEAPTVVEPPVVEDPQTTGFNVKDAGAKGDGVKDDTAAIQNALYSHDSVYIPAGEYLIDADVSLKPKSNQVLTLSPDAVLKAKPTATGYNNVIYIDGVNNVTVTGGQIIGDRHQHLGSSGEWGHGIFVRGGATNIFISDMHISDCWGDAIEIGGVLGEAPDDGVVIDNVIADGNRRQGLSITNAVNVVVKNSVFKNTSGTLPEAGIDIEPNYGCVTEDIHIENVHSYGNAGAGIDLAGFFDYKSFKNVTIVDTLVENNGYAGFRMYNTESVYIADSISRDNYYYGMEIPYDVHNATFERVTFTENMDRGVSLVSYHQKTGLSNLNFIDCEISNNSQRSGVTTDGVRIDNYDGSGYINSVGFVNCDFIDTQSSPIKPMV